jgi:hypothetical protein
MKLAVPGLAKSEGKKLPPPLVPGKYEVEIPKVPTSKDSENSDGVNITFELVVVGGPDQEDGSDPQGRLIFHRVFIMGPDHPSFEEWGHLGVDDLADMAAAFGVKVTRSDNIELEDFQGKVAIVSVGRKEDNYQGEKRIVNVVKKAYPLDEEGAE